MDSHLLGEQILVVYEKEHLKEAEHEHPELVAYFPPEIDELRRLSAEPGFRELVRTIHAIKKIIGGWVVPRRAEGDGAGRTRAAANRRK